jgi:hypothetical protein
LVVTKDYEENLARVVAGQTDAAALNFHVDAIIAARLYLGQLTPPRNSRRRAVSLVGQNEKASQRAFLDRCTPESGRSFERGERQLRANTGHKPVSFDHLVGAGEQHGRDGEAERFCGL